MPWRRKYANDLFIRENIRVENFAKLGIEITRLKFVGKWKLYSIIVMQDK